MTKDEKAIVGPETDYIASYIFVSSRQETTNGLKKPRPFFFSFHNEFKLIELKHGNHRTIEVPEV